MLNIESLNRQLCYFSCFFPYRYADIVSLNVHDSLTAAAVELAGGGDLKDFLHVVLVLAGSS